MITSKELGDLQQQVAELKGEVEALNHLADVGEVAGVLAHEFSDFLNLLLLQVAVLEYRLPESERADLAELRRQGNRATELVSRFQQYRRSPRGGDRITDLAAVASATVAQLNQEMVESGNGVKLCLGETVACPLRRPLPELRRLARFLIANAVRAAAGDCKVVVSVEPNRLIVENNGPPATENELGHLFSLSTCREGADRLEMTACRSLSRRLRARLSAEARPEGGVRVVVEFEQAGR